MKWSDPRIAVALIVIVYLIFDREMNRVRDYSTTKQRVELEREKREYELQVKEQDQKIQLYEITMEQKSDAVNTMSNDDIDSLWSVIHG